MEYLFNIAKQMEYLFNSYHQAMQCIGNMNEISCVLATENVYKIVHYTVAIHPHVKLIIILRKLILIIKVI